MDLQTLIRNTNILSVDDRNYLLTVADTMAPLEKLRLTQALEGQRSAEVVQILTQLRSREVSSIQAFQENRSKEQEIQNQSNNLVQKAMNFLTPKRDKNTPIHTSVLTQNGYMGASTPTAAAIVVNKPLNTLRDLEHLCQLKFLKSEHIYFDLNQNFEQEINSFLTKIDKLFDEVTDIAIKRSFFMNYIQSSLFNTYMSTGLTALKHPELQPAKIVLNLLHQVNPGYLNNRQFRHAAIITNHIRFLVGV